MSNNNNNPSKRDVRVVIFDLWRTLWLSVDKEPIKDVQRILGHKMGPGAHGHMEPELDPDFMRVCLTTNISDPERFLQYVAGRFGYKVPDGAVDEFMHILDRERLNLAKYADADPTLEGLKRRGYRLGVISNLWPFPASHIFEATGFHDHFEHRIYSFEVGHRKPEKEIFEEACRRFGVQPQECLMVGDHPEADVKGALSAGMQAALIDRPGEFKFQIAGVPVLRSLTELLDETFKK